MVQNLELELLPIGSVVKFKTWEQPLMIYGRKQEDSKLRKLGIMWLVIILLEMFQLNIICF